MNLLQSVMTGWDFIQLVKQKERINREPKLIFHCIIIPSLKAKVGSRLQLFDFFKDGKDSCDKLK